MRRFLKLFCKIIVLFCTGETALAKESQRVRCPSEFVGGTSQSTLVGWKIHDAGSGRLSDAYVMRLGEHYEEMPDPVKTGTTTYAGVWTTASSYRLISLWGEPWNLYCQYGEKDSGNTVMWHELPGVFSECVLKESLANNKKELEAFCK